MQEISDDDAFEGGASLPDVPLATYRAAYRTLWNTLYGPDAWDRNEWVAAYTFTTRKGNIDEVKE